jgi:very-short-patch-repair endonuclease
LKLDKCAIIPDFFIKNQNKIIDFDGDYYHRKGSPNEQRKKERDAAIIRNGYKILHIKEKDFRTNKQETIQQCIDFINN